MKKISLLLLSLALIITSCKKETMPEKNKTLPFYVGNYVFLNTNGATLDLRVEITEDTIQFFQTDHTHYKGQLYCKSKYNVTEVDLYRYQPESIQHEKYMLVLENPMTLGGLIDRIVVTEMNAQGQSYFIIIRATNPFRGDYIRMVKAYN